MEAWKIEEIEEFERLNQLDDIITNNYITPVFQPIISLKDGSVYGFEALSRITMPGLFHDDVEEMFRCAERNGCIWQLEQVCRRGNTVWTRLLFGKAIRQTARMQ